MSGRVVLWCQHLLGTGHLRRAAALARAMTAAGLDATLVSGGEPVPWLRAEGFRVVQLPPLRALSEDFADLRAADGRPPDAGFRARRAAALAGALDEAAPDVFVTEMFPFGRRAFMAELDGAIGGLRRRRPRPWIVASVRDLLVRPSRPERHEEAAERVRRLYDRVLVHADPRLVPFETSFAPAPRIADRLTYTGFVLEGDAPPPAPATDEVLVSAGGGAVGGPLLRAALAARPLTAYRDAPWRLVGGGNLDGAAFDALEAALPTGVALDRRRDDFQSLLAGCALSVSQAGYNTVLETLRLGRPMVLVPFERGRETEQRDRAEGLARLGLARVVPEAGLTPERLAAAIDAAPPASRVPDLDLDGAAASARIVRDLIAKGPPP